MKYTVVDAFVTGAGAGSGNPAAVVALDGEVPDERLGRIAAEFNLSETAFVLGGGGEYGLRWFTPVREVTLCGHATLAAAHAVWEWGGEAAGAIRFSTRHSGVLTCRRQGGGIAMDFPATPPAPAALPAEAARVLGVEGSVECIGSAGMNLTLRVASAAQVRRCTPDMAAISAWHPVGVTVTAAGDEPGVDFVSRFFAPRCGVPEDPVTGSAHCSLACYWAAVLGKTRFAARQLSARGGDLGVELAGDRVVLSGRAVTTMRGQLLM